MICCRRLPLTKQHETKQQQSPKRQFLAVILQSQNVCLPNHHQSGSTTPSNQDIPCRLLSFIDEKERWREDRRREFSPLSNILLRRSRPVSIPLHPSRASDPSPLLTTPTLLFEHSRFGVLVPRQSQSPGVAVDKQMDFALIFSGLSQKVQLLFAKLFRYSKERTLARPTI
jgi:hypothetical protein